MHYDLWYAVERICELTVQFTVESNKAASTMTEAVHMLIDSVRFKQNGTVRQNMHACGTISKVIQKRALPLIERQVDCVDQAVSAMQRIGICSG
jgi:hypothetical protein